jgi:outer membrane protein OmpA-like peptidoglycan-associated protein
VKTEDPKTNGCPPDRDHDGILDADDACPDVPGVKTEDPKTNGCPPDRDHDGILDADDACPDVPGVKTSDPKTNGCPPDPDRDKDGIPNEQDACPDAPGPRNADPKRNGCPAAAVVGKQIVILDQVKFATGSAAILPVSNGILNAVLDVLKQHPEIKHLRVEGHTDNVGAAAMNKGLSSRRAASVATWLIQHGIDSGRMASEGFGMERPIDSNDTAAGRQNNRRVEFHIDDEAAK